LSREHIVSVFTSDAPHRHPHSFPTRRSSDLKDPRTQFPKVTSQIKLQVTPERAAVFVDDAFAGTVGEFSGAGHGMLVSPGKHRRSEEHTSELQSRSDLVCRLLLEKKKKN